MQVGRKEWNVSSVEREEPPTYSFVSMEIFFKSEGEIDFHRQKFMEFVASRPAS